MLRCPPMSRRVVLLPLGLLFVLVLGPLSARAAEYSESVSMIDNIYQPDFLRVEPGTEVTFTNDGHDAHTVTADDGSIDSGSIAPGDSFAETFDQPGVYAFHCTFHGSAGAGMAGIVMVGDAPMPESNGAVGPGREPVPTGFADTIEVPMDAPTIQEAVDEAEPGGMVLISPGVYPEAVTVTTPFVTIRGTDRNTVILDGGFEFANGIHVIEADGVSIENLTARNYRVNGFYWTSVLGYRASYVTAYNNGDYGVYALDSQYGVFEHSYASGSPDSGFYVGHCNPCNAVVDDVLAENNAIGFSGTNAGGNLAIVNSEWRNNLAGIVPNTLDPGEGAPQQDMLIAGNYVHDNNSTTAPANALGYPAYGIGILVTGGRSNVIVANLVEDQQLYGIAVLPNVDGGLWLTGGNEIRGNIVARSGIADLALGGPSAGGDCFSGNDASTSSPAAIELLYACSGLKLNPSGGGDMAPTLSAGQRFLDALDGEFPRGSYQDQPAPPDQPQMPEAAAAPPHPAIPDSSVPPTYRIRDPHDIRSAGGPRVSKEVTVFGIPLAASWWGLLLGLYGYLLPVVLYSAWVSVAIWDLMRQEAASISRRSRWMAVVLLVPFAGPVIYFWRGGSPIPRQLRLMLVAGGAVGYAIILALGVLLGG